MSQPEEALRERLKASLWFSTGRIVEEETTRLITTATPQFIGAMTEMVWAQIGFSLLSESQSILSYQDIENVAADLESFSRHAGRTTITTDDVMLITRRNEALHEIMMDFVDSERAAKARKAKTAVKGKGRAKTKK